MTHREHVVHGNVRSEHIVQLFDTPESLADAVSDFLFEGWSAGDSLLVVAKRRHWDALADRLEARGCPASSAVRDARLVVLDAAATLDRFTRNGFPNPREFREVVGSLVERLAVGGRVKLRIFGEMVELLAEQGHFDGARRLEEFWNELATEHPFSLFCGYSSAHFGDARSAPVLDAICRAHTHVHVDATDPLAAFLINENAGSSTRMVRRTP